MAAAPISRSVLASDAWRVLKGNALERIAELQVQLESTQNTEQMTMATRGRIAELRQWLRLEEAPADVPRPGDTFAVGSKRAVMSG